MNYDVISASRNLPIMQRPPKGLSRVDICHRDLALDVRAQPMMGERRGETVKRICFPPIIVQDVPETRLLCPKMVQVW